MIDILDLRFCKDSSPVSTPSISIFPDILASLKSEDIREDFPAPVRPTIPT